MRPGGIFIVEDVEHSADFFCPFTFGAVIAMTANANYAKSSALQRATAARIAAAEARRLEVPIVAIVDTNCNPDEVDLAIPANDDAIRSITLITKLMADAVLEGRSAREDKEEQSEKAPAGPANIPAGPEITEIPAQESK